MSRNIWFIVICMLYPFYGLHAQELEPRSYSVSPKGLHAAALSYTFTNGNIITDFASPIQDLKVSTSIINLGYVQTFALFNRIARIQVAQPYGIMNGFAKVNGADTTGNRNGFFDTKIKFGMNIFGSPVLSPKELRVFQERSVLGASLVISAPTGLYFTDKLINLGHTDGALNLKSDSRTEKADCILNCIPEFGFLPLTMNTSKTNPWI